MATPCTTRKMFVFPQLARTINNDFGGRDTLDRVLQTSSGMMNHHNPTTRTKRKKIYTNIEKEFLYRYTAIIQR